MLIHETVSGLSNMILFLKLRGDGVKSRQKQGLVTRVIEDVSLSMSR